jgi:hypothetical protein
MKFHLSPPLAKAVESALDRAEKDNAILDVYGLAGKIQAAHPDENVALEDIVNALLVGRGGIGAIEFAPRPPTILEIVLPGPISASALPPGDEFLGVPEKALG